MDSAILVVRGEWDLNKCFLLYVRVFFYMIIDVLDLTTVLLHTMYGIEVVAKRKLVFTYLYLSLRLQIAYLRY